VPKPREVDESADASYHHLLSSHWKAPLGIGGGHHAFEKRRPLELKGIGLVDVYKPTKMSYVNVVPPVPGVAAGLPEAVSRVERLLKQVVEDQEKAPYSGLGGVICVNGPVGCGCHDLVEHVVQWALTEGWAALKSNVDVDERGSTPRLVSAWTQGMEDSVGSSVWHKRMGGAIRDSIQKPFLAPGNMFGFLTGSKPNPDRRESAFAGALRRGSRRVSSKTDGSHRSSTTSQGSNDRRGSGDRRHRADSRGSG